MPSLISVSSTGKLQQQLPFTNAIFFSHVAVRDGWILRVCVCLFFSESVESKAVKKSIDSFSSNVKEQLLEKVKLSKF